MKFKRFTTILMIAAALFFYFITTAVTAEKGAKKKGAKAQKIENECAVALTFSSFVKYDGDVQRHGVKRNVPDFIVLDSGKLTIQCDHDLTFQAKSTDPPPVNLSDGMGLAIYDKSVMGRFSSDKTSIEELIYTETRTLYIGKRSPQPPESKQIGRWFLKLKDIPLSDSKTHDNITTKLYMISRVDESREEYVDLASHIPEVSFEIVYPDGGRMFVKKFEPNMTNWRPGMPLNINDVWSDMQRIKIPDVDIRFMSGPGALH